MKISSYLFSILFVLIYTNHKSIYTISPTYKYGVVKWVNMCSIKLYTLLLSLKCYANSNYSQRYRTIEQF